LFEYYNHRLSLLLPHIPETGVST